MRIPQNPLQAVEFTRDYFRYLPYPLEDYPSLSRLISELTLVTVRTHASFTPGIVIETALHGVMERLFMGLKLVHDNPSPAETSGRDISEAVLCAVVVGHSPHGMTALTQAREGWTRGDKAYMSAENFFRLREGFEELYFKRRPPNGTLFADRDPELQLLIGLDAVLLAQAYETGRVAGPVVSLKQHADNEKIMGRLNLYNLLFTHHKGDMSAYFREKYAKLERTTQDEYKSSGPAKIVNLSSRRPRTPTAP